MSLIAGLALRMNNGRTFIRYSKAPILHRTNNEPLLIATAPCVLKIDGIWKMWYVSGVKWINEEQASYNIKYAESLNGIIWDRKNITCVDFENEKEYAIARPYVIYENNKYLMWFSYRGDHYKIGFAVSFDGINWHRSNKPTFRKSNFNNNLFIYTQT